MENGPLIRGRPMIRRERSLVNTQNDIAALKAQLGQRQSAHHLPGWYYNSRAVYDLEVEKIFGRDWFCIGRAEELENPGDYKTIDIAGESIAVARARNGELAAFSSYCPHRGAQVVSGAGNTGKFTCPYHGWVFDLSGKLVNAPFTDDVEGFDFSSCRMTPVSLRTWRGWIFVSLEQTDRDFDGFMEEYERKLAYFRMEDCVLTDALVMDVPANWKLVLENFIDVYHFSVLHAKTFGAPSNPAVSQPYETGSRVIFRPGHRFSNPRMDPPFGEMPWLEANHHTAAGYMPPNAYIIGHSDCIRLFSSWPIDEGRSQARVDTLFPRPFTERADFAAKTEPDKKFVRQILTEDLDMIAKLQVATHSRLFNPGPMAALEEGVHTVVVDILDRLSR